MSKVVFTAFESRKGGMSKEQAILEKVLFEREFVFDLGVLFDKEDGVVVKAYVQSNDAPDKSESINYVQVFAMVSRDCWDSEADEVKQDQYDKLEQVCAVFDPYMSSKGFSTFEYDHVASRIEDLEV